MLIAAFYLFRPEDRREPRNRFGSQTPAEHLVGYENLPIKTVTP